MVRSEAAMVRIDFCYDIVSPYSYLAFVALRRYREAWDLDLNLEPIFLGGVMAATGNSPPAMLPARGVYMAGDVARLSEYFDVPLTIPDDFMTGTLPPARVLTAVKDEHPEQLEALTESFWRRYWGRGEQMDEAGMRACLEEVGLAPDLVERTQDPAVKAKLKERTDAAVERGMFGAPGIFATVDGQDELFFGQDRLPLLAHRLGLRWDGPRGPAGSP
jgi:glutathione S-transferase kappa 1